MWHINSIDSHVSSPSLCFSICTFLTIFSFSLFGRPSTQCVSSNWVWGIWDTEDKWERWRGERNRREEEERWRGVVQYFNTNNGKWIDLEGEENNKTGEKKRRHGAGEDLIYMLSNSFINSSSSFFTKRPYKEVENKNKIWSRRRCNEITKRKKDTV